MGKTILSTRFTKNEIPLADSLVLKLLSIASEFNDTVIEYVANQLIAKGYESVTPSLLSFLSELECGTNYSSEIARKLGVSRQMVGKTVKELSNLGYLEQVETDRKHKSILFTKNGEKLIGDARQILADLDGALDKQVGEKTTLTLIKNYNKALNAVEKLSGT